jgi:hypothetical protein
MQRIEDQRERLERSDILKLYQMQIKAVIQHGTPEQIIALDQYGNSRLLQNLKKYATTEDLKQTWRTYCDKIAEEGLRDIVLQQVREDVIDLSQESF